MAKHMAISHPEARKTTPFSAEVLSKHNSFLKRFIDESIHIDSNKEAVCNSKSEWGGGALVRLDPTGGRNVSQPTNEHRHRLN